MPEVQEQTYDVVVVGSGAAAFATAMGALDEGLGVVMLESTQLWGGNTTMSGGGLWLPNNPLMQREGAADSREEALHYLEQTVGEPGMASSTERRAAFVDGIEDYVLTAERHGIAFARGKDYPDYYPELPGGKIGRSIEVPGFDTHRLGPWESTQRSTMPIPIRNDDIWLISRAFSTPGGFVRGADFVFRTVLDKVRGRNTVGMGGALAASLAHAVLVKGGVPLHLETPATGLVTEDGRVVGVRARGPQGDLTFRARRGIMLAAGGFESHQEWRQKYQGVTGYTSGSPGNIGRPIEFGAEAGGALEYMDDAWWGPSLAPFEEGPNNGFLVADRALPFTIMVDARGERFANEAESYVDMGHHMLDHDRGGDFWLVTDHRFDLRYFQLLSAMPGYMKGLEKHGLKVRRTSLYSLATALGMDPETLTRTVDRFNGFARTGKDQDFRRGDSAYDRYYGDPVIRPNPNLGPLERGPFTAYKVVAGDLGTKGGLVTDTAARVLREDGTVIEGLYAAGNTSAAVMGHTYPGPGATIGPASVFGLAAARAMTKAGTHG